MQILQNKAEIRAAIATMNPVARTAAQNLAAYLLDNPQTIQDHEALNDAYLGSCTFAMTQAGWELTADTRIQAFFENHGEAVSNVAISIVAYSVKQAERHRKWGWVGKAAAFAGGALLASLFG